ncbi:MAG: AAA family ATPase [Nanoarchaeota archaeon]
MALFKGMLKDGESIFLDSLALDPEFTPPIIKYRENQQQYIAICIKPLFQKRSGKNLFIFGSPGIGKTVAVRYILNELNKETDEIETIYVNCWKKDTPYKIALDICDQIGYKFVHDKDTAELFKEVAKTINKKSAVIVLDEADKLIDNNLVYSLCDEFVRKSIILITNSGEWIAELDNRVRSRLTPDMLEFKSYNLEETKGILKQRIEYAFVHNTIDNEVLDLISEKTYEAGDIRLGLFLLKEAGELSENRSSKKITMEDAEGAIKKLKNFQIKSTSNLDEDENMILNTIRDNSGKTSMEIFDLYKKLDGKQSYASYQRKLKNLERGKFISLRVVNRGQPGRSTVVEWGYKRLDDF